MRVNRVQDGRLGLVPVGNETPFHRVHHEGGPFWPCTANDGCVGTRGDVIAGHIAVSVYPLLDAKRGIAVELLLVCLVRELT